MRAPFLALLAVSFSAGSPSFGQQFGKAENLAPYIPTPMEVVDQMLAAARVKAGDTVYDLGSGDGRILITAAQKFGAKGVGVEIDPDLCRRATQQIQKLGLQDKVTMIHGSALRVDLRPADVVTMYLLTSSNDRLKPNLEKDLKPGARVVSNEFPIRGWKTLDVIKVKSGGMEHTLYVYEIGRNH